MRTHHLSSFALLLFLAASCGETQRDFDGGSGTGGAGSANAGAAGKGGSKAGAGGSATAGKGGSSADDGGEAGQGGDASGGKSGSNGAGGRSAGSAGSPEGGESGDSGSGGDGAGGEPGSSGESGASGEDSGGSAGDGGTGGSPPEPEPFACGDPLPALTFPTVLTSTATPPQPAGGVITEGVYVLTQVVIYGTYSSVPGDVFELRGGYLHHRHTTYSSSGSALTGYETIGTYATTGAAMAVDVVACGLGSGPGLWKFTASRGQIQLFTNDSSTTWVQTFELQE